MKHVFIINPNSGKKDIREGLIEKLKEYKDKIDYEIVYSMSKEEAINCVKEKASSSKEDILFYACGGDGTISVLASECFKYPNALLTCYPCGSGNDFIKIYGGKDKFLNLDNIINGEEVKIDLMKVNDKYAINVTNFGFDAEVCDVANKVRRKKIIGGRNSYTTGIVKSIFTGRKTKCKIVADDEILADGNILLSTIANGKYVGGAYCCAPKSDNQDGLLEVSVVKPITLLKFITLISPYKKGLHLDNPKFEKVIKYRKVKKVIIDADEKFKICLDGEIYTGPHFEIENMKQVVRFVKPKE